MHGRRPHVIVPKPMLRINILSRHLDQAILRQTPRSSGEWAGCTFSVNGSGRFDCVVVYDDFSSPQKFDCAPEGLLFVTGEPPTIKRYDGRFLAQFHRVLSPHSDIPHPGLIDSHCGMPWHVGMVHGAPPASAVRLTFDDFAGLRPAKTKLLSVFAARRNVTPGHMQRPALVEALRQRFGDEVDVFGRDVMPIADKWDAIGPYKYHVALENSRFANYWTEKLSDCFLGGAFPFYWGCPNVLNFFPAGSLQVINLYDPVAAVEAIARAIETDTYERSQAALDQARDAVLRRYNFFAVLADACKSVRLGTPTTIMLYPEPAFKDSWARKLRKRLRRAVPRSLRPARWNK